MSKTLKVKFKSGDDITINNFKYAKSPGQTKIENLEDLVFVNRIISFVGEDTILSFKSSEIEYFVLISK
ncbi:hypothetical protein QJR26_06975 [Clostridium baratii]